MNAFEEYIYKGLKKAMLHDIRDVAFLQDKDGVVISVMKREDQLTVPAPVPFFPQRFLDAGMRTCTLSTGIIPGGRVFSFQGY